MSPITDHPLRYALANELHARPFPSLETPCHAVFLALKPEINAASRDRELDRQHLLALLDRFGAQHPQPGATHYFGPIGRHMLKWENHTEFVTYTVFTEGLTERPFDANIFEVFPDDWLEAAPGTRVTSALIRVEQYSGEEQQVVDRVSEWFVPESLACSSVLDNSAVVATDFRIDSSGHLRFALFAQPDTGSRRMGRIVQRLTEIEIYKSMSMLGLPRARELSDRMARIDAKLSTFVGAMSAGDDSPEQTLHELLEVSTELENLLAQSSFRFSATAAYEAIVNQRIKVLREERFRKGQTFSEFMMRRYDPAMRTVKSTERRLQSMTERAIRAGDLLRTRVDVERSAQNQELLESMDRRADLQLRLQHTVEGLSVVAISYYAVSLLGYFLTPGAKLVGIGKPWLTAALVPLVVIGVWMMVRRIRKQLH